MLANEIKEDIAVFVGFGFANAMNLQQTGTVDGKLYGHLA
jgi:hypothetical protein